MHAYSNRNEERKSQLLTPLQCRCFCFCWPSCFGSSTHEAEYKAVSSDVGGTVAMVALSNNGGGGGGGGLGGGSNHAAAPGDLHDDEDVSEWENEFAQWDSENEDAPAKPSVASGNAAALRSSIPSSASPGLPVVAPVSVAITPLPSPSHLSGPASPVPILSPPPKAAAGTMPVSVLAPAPVAELDLFANMGLSSEPYKEAPRAAPKPSAANAASKLGSAALARPDASTVGVASAAVAPRPSHKFDIDNLGAGQSSVGADSDAGAISWGDESAPSAGAAAAADAYGGAHDVDIDLGLDADLAELGIDLSDTESAVDVAKSAPAAPAAAATSAAAAKKQPKKANGAASGKKKKAGIGSVVAVSAQADDADIDIDLDGLDDVPV